VSSENTKEKGNNPHDYSHSIGSWFREDGSFAPEEFQRDFSTQISKVLKLSK